MQPEHPYGVVILGLGRFGLIAFGIYASFRLMYETLTAWLDKRPKFSKKYSLKIDDEVILWSYTIN